MLKVFYIDLFAIVAILAGNAGLIRKRQFGTIMRTIVVLMDNLTFLSIDTETSGLSYTDDRILQYGFSMFIRGKCVETSTYDICQDVSNSAEHVNGITVDRIRNGHSPYNIAMLLNMVLNKHPRRIVVYNAPFDLNFIGAEFQRLGFSYSWDSVTVVDPLVIWRKFHPFQKGRLEDVARHYNIPNPAAHDAGADSATAGHVYVQMYHQYGVLRNVYSNQMFKGWYNHWAEGFQNWARTKQMDLDPLDFQWPCREEYKCWESPPVELQLELGS